MENHSSPGHPLQHKVKIAAPSLCQTENNTDSNTAASYHAQPTSNSGKFVGENFTLPQLSLQTNVLSEGEPTSKGLSSELKELKQENNITQCAYTRQEVPSTLFIHKSRKTSQDQEAAFDPYLSPQAKLRAQRSHLPQLSSCISGSNTDLDDISSVIPPVLSLSPYIGSGISEVPSFPSLLSPHSSTHQLSRKRALSGSPHSDLLSDIYRSSSNPSSLHAAGVFPSSPYGPAEQPSLPGAAMQHYRLQKQKTSIEQNQNLDGSMDTTIINKITFTDHRQRNLLRYSYPGADQPSNLALHQMAAQSMDYYDHLSPRSSCSMASHSTSNHSNPPRDEMELCTCLWEGCNLLFDEQEELVQHIETRHVEKGRAEDFICLWKGCIRKKKPFNARYKLLIHMRIHSGEKPNKCTVSL